MLKKEDLLRKNINSEKETKEYKTELTVLKRMFKRQLRYFLAQKEKYLKKFTEIPNEDLKRLRKLKAEIKETSAETSNRLMILDIIMQFYEELEKERAQKNEI